jgi:outer membrane protein assembly factor BamB
VDESDRAKLSDREEPLGGISRHHGAQRPSFAVLPSAASDDQMVLLGCVRSIQCLDVSTGEPVWASGVADGDVNSTFLVAGDRIIAGTNDASAVGVDTETGAVAWLLGALTFRATPVK